MQFSRLRLSGFKSFVDPVDLDILPGLTGVVGPNGCGKSNLLEALRWAMGETSYKSMRGSGMEDVIFSGTTSRPSRNHAEVALFLDNHDHTAPAEYNDSELLEIVRRIERDAGSAYRINGRDVRAKDVQLFFADASTGARSTALVKQGQIGELISAKPEARRRILEEAAGISGLHSRRHEAELRLRAAEGNLEKVDEVIGQMESQLRALKRQSRQATRYRALSGEIRQSEALGLHVQWSSIVAQLSEIELALERAREAVRDRTQAAAQASTQQTEVQASLPALREAEAVAAAALRRLTIERENLDAEERRSQEMIERLTKLCAELLADREREQVLYDDAVAQIAVLEEEMTSLQAASEAGEKEAEARAREVLAERIAALEGYENELDAANRAVADRAARQTALTQEIDVTTARLARVQEQITEREGQLNTLAAHQPPANQQQETLARCEAAEQNLSTFASQLQTIHAQLRDIERQIEERGEPLRQARAHVERLVGERAALSALFARPNGQSFPAIIDALSVEKGYETALGAALGDDLIASSDEAAPAHWRSLPPLASGTSLPAGVEPLSNFVSGSSNLLRRLSQVGVLRDTNQARDLQAALSIGQRLVSLNGDLWRWDGYCAISEAPTAATQRLAQRNRLNELGGELDDAEALAGKLDQDLTALKQMHRDMLSQEENTRQFVDTAREDLAAARDDVTNATRQNEDYIARTTAIQEALSSLNGDMTELRQSLVRAQGELDQLPPEQDLQQQLTQIREQVALGRSEASEARAAFEQLRSQREQREARMVRVKGEHQSWSSRQLSAQKQVEALDARHDETRAELERLLPVPAQLEARKNALIDLITQAEQERRHKADALASAEAALTEADKLTRATQAALSEVREDFARQEANRENAIERESDAAQKIREVLQVEPDGALALADHAEGKPLPAYQDIEAKLEKLRRERENLGGVNLQADVEAGEIEEQLVAMQAERDDLRQAVNKLRYGIGQLNREGRERLLQAFESVNTHFMRLFTQLFGGGSARLELTESDDPLEAGLEIIAHPPGKKPQLMSLLSGGEQALTAMALIFAVFMTNPSPICVLDEVDAPLDDANVERFCAMIREISDATGTRFLLITHHALTMARVDRLYGVTMQERGVSSLISVDLRHAEQYAEAGGGIERDAQESKIKA